LPERGCCPLVGSSLQPSDFSLQGLKKFYDILPGSHRNVIELFKIVIYGLRESILMIYILAVRDI